MDVFKDFDNTTESVFGIFSLDRGEGISEN